MTVQIVTKILCDRCHAEYVYPAGGKANVLVARNKARNQGWWAYLRQGGRMVDLCPKCLEAEDEKHLSDMSLASTNQT